MNPFLAKSNSVTAVAVEYTGRGGVRVVKQFAGPAAVSASRTFYRAKLKAGKTPRVVSAARGTDTLPPA